MSPSASITVRRTRNGERRYHVRYRLGGRAHPVHHAGSFKTERDAKERLRFVVSEIAAGRDPRLALRQLAEPQRARDLDGWFGEFITARVDVGPKSTASYKQTRARLGRLAHRDPHQLIPQDFQAWIADNQDLAPASLGQYLSGIRQVLDFADVEPNPARSAKVKLPPAAGEEIAPPSGAEWRRIKPRLSRRLMLPVRLKECLALRTKELRALTYGDLDFAGERIRVSRARTKRRTAGQRWLPVPRVLLDEIADLVPLEDRHRDRRVFPELGETTLWTELERACRLAGVAHYPPHQLRHRRCSLWLANGIDELTAARWAGHSKPSMTLDVYGHVLIDPYDDEWRDFWLDAYRRERLPGAAGSDAGVVPVEDGADA